MYIYIYIYARFPIPYCLAPTAYCHEEGVGTYIDWTLLGACGGFLCFLIGMKFISQ